MFLLQELTENIKQLSEEVKKLKGEKQSLTQQLNESLAKLGDQSQDGLGKVLEEKFNLEKKVIVQFRIHQNRWIKIQQTHLYRVNLNLKRSGENSHPSVLFSFINQHFPAGICEYFSSA